MRELDIATYVATFAHVVTPVPLQDDEAVPNLQLSPSLLQLRTLADITPPVWSTGSPAITSVTDKSGLLSVELDEPGVVHFIYIALSATAPSNSQLRAGFDGDGTAALAKGTIAVLLAGVPATYESTGSVLEQNQELTASTEYTV